MTKLTTRMLTRRQREFTRQTTRNAWIATDNDEEATLKLATAQIKEEFRSDSVVSSIITMILVKLAVDLAVYLIKKWLKDKVSFPPVAYQPDEPGYLAA